MDGKHVVLQAPFNSGSNYYNYKSSFSIVLFAVVDAKYNFMYANVGCQGRISDGGVFRNTSLFNDMQSGNLRLPEPEPLPTMPTALPYVFVADDAFPLQENIMKPYPGLHSKGSRQRSFNYRLSRARRIVENAFGILSAVFRVLRKPMLLQPEKAELIVLACIYLHNFLRRSKSSKTFYTPVGALDREEEGQILEGEWRRDSQDLTSLLPLQKIGRKSTQRAQDVRQTFAQYFSDQRLPWQDEYE